VVAITGTKSTYVVLYVNSVPVVSHTNCYVHKIKDTFVFKFFSFRILISGTDLPQKKIRKYLVRILISGADLLRQKVRLKIHFSGFHFRARPTSKTGPTYLKKWLLTFQDLIPGFNFRARPTSKKRFVPKFTFQDLISGPDLPQKKGSSQNTLFRISFPGPTYLKKWFLPE
jgi:hypothetical protein